MPKISESRRNERRVQITDAALRCFARTGYQGTSMADIIAESGLSAGAIYGYYPSKQHLLFAVAERVMGARIAEIATVEGDHALSPAEIVRVITTGLRSEAPLQVLLQVWGEATVDAELRALAQSVIGRVRQTICDALTQWARSTGEGAPLPPEEWARAATPVILSILPGFVVQSTLFDSFDEDAFLAAVGLVLPGGHVSGTGA
ncbi:TetR/AcrR family transcriptional regulator [Microbacterium sp. C7(2022)]|uniref:TetR/AcrR family transcriptional regulator n=1 Tax=Microbacterium sp. C7(2022) TaxID=2992759 RepID=UPI00237C128E|nr:TetR/AcrR family transcriptional regulator [Microbacterium sp. C7(2022)]MDE0546705.1 TetR/AcrR family transcriptional regulator [Microbacterium sp. C7(2022)]